GRRFERLARVRARAAALLAGLRRLLLFLAVLRPLETFFAISLFHHFHEVAHFMDHAAYRRCVLALHDLMHPAQSESADGLAHVIGATDEADHPFHFHGAAVLLAIGGGFLGNHLHPSRTAPLFSLWWPSLNSSSAFYR